MSTSDYSKLKVDQLKTKLRQRGIPDPGLLKQGLIAALEEADRQASNSAKQQSASKVPPNGPPAQGDAVSSNTVHVRRPDALAKTPKLPMPSHDEGRRLDDRTAITTAISANSSKIALLISAAIVVIVLVFWISSSMNSRATSRSATNEPRDLPWVCHGCDKKGQRFANGEPVVEWCTEEQCG